MSGVGGGPGPAFDERPRLVSGVRDGKIGEDAAKACALPSRRAKQELDANRKRQDDVVRVEKRLQDRRFGGRARAQHRHPDGRVDDNHG